MIKQWYTASELADLQLNEIPTSLKGVLKRAEREGWTSRDRAQGKGKEYHVSNLPDAVQVALIEKAVGRRAITELQCKAAAFQMEKERGRAKFTEEERATARVIIVSSFENFRAATSLGVLQAEGPFLKLYMAEKAASSSEIIPAWVFDIYPEFSVQTLRLWRSSRKKAASIKELAAKYGNRKGSSVVETAEDGLVSTYIVALITKQPHLTAGHIRDLLRAKFGEQVRVKRGDDIVFEPIPEIWTIKRFVKRWTAENKGLYLNLTNPDAYKSSYQPAFGRADSHIRDLNQVWEFDASPVDAMCVDGRYNMYSLVDVYSRRAIFYVTKTPKTDGSLLLIRRAILAWGVPQSIKTDNGSDFTSYRFQNALISLGINQDICTPYTPENKGFVERVFRTLQHDLMPLLPGYIGHNVADRKAIENSKAFSVRLGESEKDAFAIEMSAEELQRYVDDWANNRYGDRVHSTTRETPNERAKNWIGTINKIANERVLDILLAPIASGNGYRKVTKKGIRTDNAEFFSPVLGLHIGENVFVRHHPEDMGRIYVFKSEKGEFICEAINPESLGISGKEASAEAKALQKAKISEKRKEIKAIQRSIKPRDMVDTILRKDAEAAANVINFRPSNNHSSPAIDTVHSLLGDFVPEKKTKLTEAQEKAHQELIIDIAQPKPKVVDLNSKEGRIKRALALEERLNSGNRISAEDQSWLTKYQTLPEFIAHKKMKDAFGLAWFDTKE